MFIWMVLIAVSLADPMADTQSQQKIKPAEAIAPMIVTAQKRQGNGPAGAYFKLLIFFYTLGVKKQVPIC